MVLLVSVILSLEMINGIKRLMPFTQHIIVCFSGANKEQKVLVNMNLKTFVTIVLRRTKFLINSYLFIHKYFDFSLLVQMYFKMKHKKHTLCVHVKYSYSRLYVLAIFVNIQQQNSNKLRQSNKLV